jgi:hypothetical protein
MRLADPSASVTLIALLSSHDRAMKYPKLRAAEPGAWGGLPPGECNRHAFASSGIPFLSSEEIRSRLCKPQVGAEASFVDVAANGGAGPAAAH